MVVERPFSVKDATGYVCGYCGNPAVLMVDTGETLICPVCEKKQLKKKAKFPAPATVSTKADTPLVTSTVKAVVDNRGRDQSKVQCAYCGKMVKKGGMPMHKRMHVRAGDKVRVMTTLTQEPKPPIGIIEEMPKRIVLTEREVRDRNEQFQRQ